MHLICRKCKAELSSDNWYLGSQRANDYICKVCAKEKSRAHRQENPHRANTTTKAWLSRHPGYASQQHARRKQFVTDLKLRTPCHDCGKHFPPECMDFDHLPGFQKAGLVSQFANWGRKEKAMEEIKKCEIVCANCHRIRTKNRRAQKKASAASVAATGGPFDPPVV